ncbi:MAG: diguanylate cyclase [Clostridiales bacterium]|jgi:enoyl-[acyl-carrier protein] reductase II|nr:diguanylate cyclase [Clostridiales bacterium]
MKETRISKMLGIKYPIIQAPMTWVTSAELVSEVCNAGGIGTLGPNAGQNTVTNSIVETGERLRREIHKVRSLTDKPFGVNLIMMGDDLNSQDTFGGNCLKIILEEKVPLVITSGFPPDQLLVKKLHDKGTLIFHREPNINVDSARVAEASGIDAIIAVGFESGGHLSAYRIPIFTLIPLIVDNLSIPVIAGGGIVDNRGIEAALSLGAEGVYLGTRFIASTECPACPSCKQAILDATDTSTTVLEDSFGMLVRALAKNGPQAPVELYNPNTEEAPISALVVNTGGIREGMLEGDFNKGTVSISIASAMIKSVKPVKEIINDLVQGS